MVNSKGQVTIPKTIRELLNIHAKEGKALFATERSRAKSAVARRVREETE